MQEPIEALTQQPRSDQEDDGDGELNDHEIGAHAFARTGQRRSDRRRSRRRARQEMKAARSEWQPTARLRARQCSDCANSLAPCGFPRAGGTAGTAPLVLGIRLVRHLHRPFATRTPAAHPSVASRKAFGHKLPEMRAGVAPKAPRTAISRRRDSERTRSRLATLTDAMRSRRPDAARSVNMTGFMGPTMISERG